LRRSLHDIFVVPERMNGGVLNPGNGGFGNAFAVLVRIAN
jgi:hypothetical protein